MAPASCSRWAPLRIVGEVNLTPFWSPMADTRTWRRLQK